MTFNGKIRSPYVPPTACRSVCFFTLHFYTEKRESIRRNWGLTNIFLFLRSEDEEEGHGVEGANSVAEGLFIPFKALMQRKGGEGC